MASNKPRTPRKKKEIEKDEIKYKKEIEKDENKDKKEDEYEDEYEDNNYNDGKSLDKIDQLQKEFDLSDLEMEDINKFIQSLPIDDNLNFVLEELVKTDSLNVRQKVAFAHALGIFRAEGNLRSKKAIVIEIPSF